MNSVLPARRFKLAVLAGLFASGLLAQEPSGAAPVEAEDLARLQATLETQRQEIERLEVQARESEERLQALRSALSGGTAAPERHASATDVTGFARVSRTASTPPPDSPATPATPPPQCSIWSPPSSQAGAPQAILHISDSVCFRFGAEIQSNYEALQDANGEGYSQNFYLRRVRFMLLGILGHGVTTFLDMDGGTLLGSAGQTGVKNVNTGFRLVDAFAQWAFAGRAMALQAGLFLVPSVRQVLTKNWEFMSLDVADWVYQEQTALTENVVRDYGIGLNGAVLDDRLSYRFGVFDGYRSASGAAVPPLGAPAGSRNPPRIAGRLMYDFFEPEQAYSYNGTFLGPNKVASVAFVGDGQGPYRAFGGDAFFQWPVGPGSAVTAEADFLHYDGNGFVYQIGGVPTPLPEQQTFFTNAGWSFLNYKVQPFIRYETLAYPDPVNLPKEQSRVGGGVNYYVLGFNFKLTGFYERVMPKVQPTTAALKDTNRFVLQLQGFFY